MGNRTQIDHVGNPIQKPQTFQIRVGNGEWENVSTDANNELVLPPANGQTTKLTWAGDPPQGDFSYPVLALYERTLKTPDDNSLSAHPDKTILLPADFKRGHLQTLELARWLAPRTAGTSDDLVRYRPDSCVEPIVDGIPTFERLVDDLLASASPGNGAHFAGWDFKDFPLIPGQKDTTLLALDEYIEKNGGNACYLVFKSTNFAKDPGEIASDESVTLLSIIIVAALLAYSSELLFIGKPSKATFNIIIAVGSLAILFGWLVETIEPGFTTEQIENIVEESKDFVNALKQKVIWAVHPVEINDNPLSKDFALPLNLDKYAKHFGSWHQKIQLFKRGTADDEGNQYVAYVGGIDINSNRLDTPGHHGRAYTDPTEAPETGPSLESPLAKPFHDVHARITGPGAADVFKTWDERYNYHKDIVNTPPAKVFEPPPAHTLSNQKAKHIVQVGRTYHKPKSGTDFSFAPKGETTINDTLIRAIKAAREYIYIEDQYFTPNDSSKVETYFNVLLEARKHCKRLVILVPAETDQPFGDERRRFLFNKLREPEKKGWGDRVLIGTPLRRPVLGNPGRVASQGRCILTKKIGKSETIITLGPKARVPHTMPFWLWIDGELMLAYSFTGNEPTALGVLSVEVNVVQRGSFSLKPRQHQAGAAVTLAQLNGIYVHSKMMIIDDIFVAIGSSNMNRRGLFHDGEINVSAVPEQLKAAPDNPARALRTALWAEHLGLAPSMGLTLLGDPIAAFELFKRSRYAGNRFTPFNDLDLRAYAKLNVSDGLLMSLLPSIAGLGVIKLRDIIWNLVADPTSQSDPDATPGPTPP